MQTLVISGNPQTSVLTFWFTQIIGSNVFLIISVKWLVMDACETLMKMSTCPHESKMSHAVAQAPGFSLEQLLDIYEPASAAALPQGVRTHVLKPLITEHFSVGDNMTI